MSREHRSAGIFTTDRALIVRSWDSWLTEASGIREDEVRGRPLAELFPELESRGLLSRLRRVCDEGTVEVLAPAFHHYLIQLAPRAPSAHFTHMQQHVTLAPLSSGTAVVGVLVTIEDVTARRDRERTLASQLNDPDDGVRLGAVRALAEEADAVSPLAGALADASWRVRRAAAEGLASAAEDASVDALLGALRDRHRDPAVLNATLTALIRTRHDVVPSLLRIFATTEDADLRMYTALALGLLEDRRAVPTLIGALGDADANVRFHAIEALGRIGSREAALPLAAVAETREFSVAFPALDALGLIDEPSVAPQIVSLLDDPSLAASAAEALGQFGREDVVGALATRLGNPEVEMPAVARALANVHARLDARREQDLVVDLARAVVTAETGERLIERLGVVAEADRDALLQVIGWLEVRGAEGVVARMLAHPSARRAAADILANRGAAAVDALLDMLPSADEETCKAIAATLGRIGDTRAVPALVALLSETAEVAIVAAGALGSIGDGRALDPLIARLDHPQAGVRRAAAAALNSVGHPDMGARICALLDDASPRVRESAATIAGYHGLASCVDALLARCHDPDETVRRAAVEQLAHFDDPRALATLTDALASGTPAVRGGAARALAHVELEHALPRLRLAARDVDPWVRYHAARSAGTHRDPGLVPLLVGLATADPVPPVRVAAVESLATIGESAGLAALVPLGDDPDPMVAQAVLAALGRSIDSAARDALRGALGSPDPSRQIAALQALGQTNDAGLVAIIAGLASDSPKPAVREQALDTLSRVGTEDAVAAMVRIAEAPRRAREVTDALSRVDAPPPAWLLGALTGPDVSVRCVAIEILGRAAHRDAPALLARMLEDGTPAVQVAAARALERLDLRAARSIPHSGVG